ncbi:contact-dependent growth inhibition system immunity protein [Streptomyces sp. NPDC047880]|uniref:contact-dependent growth inhibition system immunity protein n=1 Tax=Streptomyces sp. NPDC047880 TaxID=3155626 RepID=UPI003454075F
MPQPVDPAQSLEQLEGRRWPDPPQDTTSMVKAVHELRRRPVGTLEPDELARLITQDVGLEMLTDLSRYVKEEVDGFLASLPKGM